MCLFLHIAVDIVSAPPAVPSTDLFTAFEGSATPAMSQAPASSASQLLDLLTSSSYSSAAAPVRKWIVRSQCVQIIVVCPCSSVLQAPLSHQYPVAPLATTAPLAAAPAPLAVASPLSALTPTTNAAKPAAAPEVNDLFSLAVSNPPNPSNVSLLRAAVSASSLI